MGQEEVGDKGTMKLVAYTCSLLLNVRPAATADAYTMMSPFSCAGVCHWQSKVYCRCAVPATWGERACSIHKRAFGGHGLTPFESAGVEASPHTTLVSAFTAVKLPAICAAPPVTNRAVN